MEIRDSGQIEKAKLEDSLVDILYDRYKELVFHGGTAIWRCYSGNRFSRDLDFYMKGAEKDKMVHYKEMAEFLKERGFAIKEKGYSNSTKTMHFLVESNAKMKIDVNFNYKMGTPVEYIKVDGSRIVVLALTPEELLNEKIDAYLKKINSADENSQPEIQDLYDMYYLSTIVKSRKPGTVKMLVLLLDEMDSKPPANQHSLGHLILSGVPPTFDFMIKKLRDWANDNE